MFAERNRCIVYGRLKKKHTHKKKKQKKKTELYESQSAKNESYDI